MYRRIRNYNNIFDYFLVRSKNRTRSISIRVINNLVYIYAPKTLNEAFIDNFISRNKEKILNHINKQIDSKNFLKYLGKVYKTKIIESKLLRKPFCSIDKNNGFFYIYKPNKSEIDINGTINSWKKSELYSIITSRIKYFLEKYEFNYNIEHNKLTIKNMVSKWGSCSFKHNLNFNVNLLEKRKEIIDYLVVHELTHTIHFNHSKEFWNHVLSIIPNYLELKRELKD